MGFNPKSLIDLALAVGIGALVIYLVFPNFFANLVKPMQARKDKPPRPSTSVQRLTTWEKLRSQCNCLECQELNGLLDQIGPLLVKPSCEPQIEEEPHD